MRLSLVLSVLLSLPVSAQESQLPIQGFGQFFDVPQHESQLQDMRYRIAYDIDEKGADGELNYSVNTPARFINMHVAHGVPAENINLAIVIHGSATMDVLKTGVYQKMTGKPNATQPLIEQLLENGVEIYLCGQSAAYKDIGQESLIPGVKLALSAMTAHAALQQRGYTLNPF